MQLKLNKSASFLIKKRSLVVYCDYNFYFFEKETKKWLELIISGKKGVFPSDFVYYLKSKDIII